MTGGWENDLMVEVSSEQMKKQQKRKERKQESRKYWLWKFLRKFLNFLQDLESFVNRIILRG